MVSNLFINILDNRIQFIRFRFISSSAVIQIVIHVCRVSKRLFKHIDIDTESFRERFAIFITDVKNLHLHCAYIKTVKFEVLANCACGMARRKIIICGGTCGEEPLVFSDNTG